MAASSSSSWSSSPRAIRVSRRAPLSGPVRLLGPRSVAPDAGREWLLLGSCSRALSFAVSRRRFPDAAPSCDELARAMEDCSRDLLCGIGRGDAPPPRAEVEDEVELSLGLSLGGRFGRERKGDKLSRSSSVAAILMPQEAAVLPTGLARTSSLPVKAEAPEVAERKQGPGGWVPFRDNGDLAVEGVARPPGSGSPSSGSSDGEGQRLLVNIADPLVRTSSLPAGIEDELRKRKAAQSLKRLELKKKRIERRNSHACNISKEAAGQILEEMNANTEKLEGCHEAVPRNKLKHSNGKRPMNGLPPVHQAAFTSQDCILSAIQKKPNSTFKGTAGPEDCSSSSAVPPHCVGKNGTAASTPPYSSSVARAGVPGSRGDQHGISVGTKARAKSMGDAERLMMQMPCVSTKGLANGNRLEGFLYKCRKGEEVRIVCVCHGSFWTPAEFVKHAGGGVVANPLRHIIVNPTPHCFL